jgi:hypothetical protein
MQNKYLSEDDIKQVFFQTKMDDPNGYDLDELLDFADKVILTAAFNVARAERELCIEFVESLNSEVAKALREKRGNL